MQPTLPISRLVRRVRWRLRLQTAVQRLVVVGAATLAAVAVAIVLVKVHLLDVAHFEPIALGATGVAALAFVSGLFRRIDDIAAAARLDAASELHDRLGSALAFAREASPTAFQLAAIEDAALAAPRASPKLAAPWVLPAFLGWLAVSGAGVGGAVAVTYEVGEDEGRALRPLILCDLGTRPRPQLSSEDRSRLEEEAQKIEEVIAQTSDPRARSLLAELNELIRAMQEGKISARDAHAKMAALDAAQEAWSEEVGEGLEETAEKLREAADEQLARRKGKPHALDAALEALRQEAWKEAAREMERVADKLAGKNGAAPGDREKTELARDMAKLAEAIESERQKAMKKLKEERSRLKKKEQRLGEKMPPREKSRLDKTQRELEKLEREEETQSEARRTLERLQREAERSAESLARRGEQLDGETAEALRKAADQLRRMAEQQEGRQQMRSAEGKMGDLKEMLKRAAQAAREGGEGGGEGGKDGEMKRFQRMAQGGAPGAGEGGGQKPGGQGGQGEDGGACEDGADGQNAKTMLAQGGKGGDLLLLGPGGQGAPRGGRSSQGDGGQGDGGEPGGGAGTGHDPKLFGDKTDNDVKTRDAFVAGREGDGPSRSQVVFTAAKKGFATQNWRDVHQDYSGVANEALDKQKIPAGQRQYVRRYFDLIRPR